jgi:hypothetical protein
MSTPSGKPSHPIELSAYPMRKARERADAEPDPVESGNDPLRSPYAPKRTHQGAGTAPSFVKNHLNAVVSAYAPKRAKEGASVEPDAAVRADAESPVCAPAGPHDHPAAAEHAPLAEREAVNVAERQVINVAERQAIDEAPLCPNEVPGGWRAAAGPLAGKHGSLDQSRAALDHGLGEHVLEPDQATSLAPSGAAVDRQPAPARGERPDKIIDGPDIAGLEASLRWLQLRQAAAMRLPRAPTLPPPRSRPAPPDVIAGAHSRERMADAIRSPLLTLEPTRLMPPPMGSDRNPNTMLGVSIACMLMAAIVLYYLAAGRSPSSPAMSRSQTASVAPRPLTSTIDPERTAQPERRPSESPDGDREILAEAEKLSQRAVMPQATSAPQRETMAIPQPAAAGAETPPASKPVRALDPENVSLLIKEGEKHIATGDVVTARMIFQRAAEAGDATAALALAATYDPMMLAKLGVMGMGSDVEKARTWYQMAESFGSAEAKQRLQLLDRH